MMMDAWFWPYLMRVIIITGVMVGLIYAVFFWLKFNNPGVLAKVAPASQMPQVNAKSAFIDWLVKRLGLQAATPNDDNTQATTMKVPVVTPVAPLAAVLPIHAAVEQSTPADADITLFGPHTLGPNQTLSVLTVDNTRYVLATTPEGVTVLDTHSIPATAADTKEAVVQAAPLPEVSARG